MSPAQILASLQALAERHLQYAGTLRADTLLAEEVAQDSLARLTLIVEVENTFHTCIDDDEASALRTVGDVVQLLQRRGG